jgi:hypothetical protein
MLVHWLTVISRVAECTTPLRVVSPCTVSQLALSSVPIYNVLPLNLVRELVLPDTEKLKLELTVEPSTVSLPEKERFPPIFTADALEVIVATIFCGLGVGDGRGVG